MKTRRRDEIMSETKICPRCGMPMDEARGIGNPKFVTLYGKRRRVKGEGIVPHVCPRCGYIELYVEKKG